MNITRADSRRERATSQPVSGNRAESDAAVAPTPAGRSPSRRRRWLVFAAATVVVVAVATALAVTFPRWAPALRRAAESAMPPANRAASGQHVEEGLDGNHAGHDHAGETHAHPGHSEETSLALSEQGRKNIGLTLATIELSDPSRAMTIPATLTAIPGASRRAVSAPLTGIVTKVIPLQGEAVEPGQPLFELRLTHEDVVEKQSQLLESLESRDVVASEIARLDEMAKQGIVPGKRLLDQQYQRQKLDATILAARQALRLHGLLESQIEHIVDKRELVDTLTVVAPEPAHVIGEEEHSDLMQVAELHVRPGQHVQTGTPLATLTDHCVLYIQGRAFEQDAAVLNEAASTGAELTALIDGGEGKTNEVDGLTILYVEDTVETESRALKFHVALPNALVRNERTDDGRRFISWRHKPGQRVQLLAPVERWTRQIVLPPEAVVQDGAETYVYQYVNGHFDRKTVHVKYRDQQKVVIERDGALFPGDQVAAHGAYQIHLALKNKAGGGVDPHAGHNH